MDDLVDLVRRSLSEAAAEEFAARVDEQAQRLRRDVAAGEYDTDDFAVGLEVEVYGVDAGGGDGEGREEGGRDDSGRLTDLPESVFAGSLAGELGVHNAEINTDPDVFDQAGLESQAEAFRRRVAEGRDAAAAEGRDLALDAMWTIPPAEGSEAYLSAVEDESGVVVAENMHRDARYVALDNDTLRHAGGEIAFSVPGADHAFPTILFESLATSVQPHLQIPTAERFPAYYNAAIRTLGPVLALTANSPFLPPDLYNRVDDPRGLLSETHRELRIAAFEQSVNTSANPKVRVPDDLETAADVVDHVVADDTFAPFLREWVDEDPDGVQGRHWEFDHKRGTYWRWLRCVIGGDPVDGAGDERSLRIEYRPVPTQPTVDDVAAVQALVAGLLRGLVARDHPLADLPWNAAERSFYAAAREGLDANLDWVTVDGERTSDRETVYDELFDLARAGLDEAGLSGDRADDLLRPLERRWAARTTPAAWKIERVREYLDDGLDLTEAIHEMQRDYFDLSREDGVFADWL
ncbi:hypothetical protein [Halomicrobium salinisoli]|uniref:hypothetical protein n=1 Tax=Halomicrobium salinisoli TaxID=2878391 RepID=UPI001CEFDCC4|nr:hypothetical protein [Halomicrobium salinisoli]